MAFRGGGLLSGPPLHCVCSGRLAYSSDQVLYLAPEGDGAVCTSATLTGSLSPCYDGLYLIFSPYLNVRLCACCATLIETYSFRNRDARASSIRSSQRCSIRPVRLRCAAARPACPWPAGRAVPALTRTRDASG